LQPGQYYLVAQAGPSSGVTYSINITAPATAHAYLYSTLSLDKTSLVAGDAFTAIVTIQNLGVAASNAGVAYLVWSEGDEQVGQNDAPFVTGGIAVPALAPGQTYTTHLTVQSPSNVHGTLNVGLFADVAGQTPQDNTAGGAASASLESDYAPDRLQPNGSFGTATE